MIIFGGRASNIGNFDIPNCKCSYCEEGNTQRISVFGKYAHVFWIPVFPIGRTAIAECTHCKHTITQKEFSPELKRLYQENKIRRPFTHWIGLGIISVFIAFMSIIGVNTEEDPRRELLRADEKLMISNPTIESDSISYKIKQLFDNFATEEIDPSDFKYLTKISEDKALVLVQIPKLRKVRKEDRIQALEMVEMITNDQQVFKNKDLYIGIKGIVSMLVIKTPTYKDNSRIALTSKLLEFYGPKPVVKSNVEQ